MNRFNKYNLNGIDVIKIIILKVMYLYKLLTVIWLYNIMQNIKYFSPIA